MDFRKMDDSECAVLTEALRNNVEKGAPIRINRFDTSFAADEEETDEKVISQIRSVPCHYA